MGWGYQPERVQAGIYLLFYTLLASLPLLVAILFIYSSLRSLCLFILRVNGSLVCGLFYICIVFAFFRLGCLYLRFIYDFLRLMLMPVFLVL